LTLALIGLLIVIAALYLDLRIRALWGYGPAKLIREIRRLNRQKSDAE
jgi:hypothetical protein